MIKKQNGNGRAMKQKYYVVVRFSDRESWGAGRVKIWRYYDEDQVWGSPASEVLDYFNSRSDAQAFVRACKK